MNSLQRLLPRSVRLGLFVLVTLIIVGATLARAPVIQDPTYNRFADRRVILGIPNFEDVVSNLPFLFVGLAGLSWVIRPTAAEGQKVFETDAEKIPYLVLFVGVTLTSFGSAYYHLAPSDNRLVWDRLPMTLTFTSFFAAVVAERVDRKAGLALLFPYVAVGLGSVIYWHLTELKGSGDLRVYMDVQYYSMLGVLLMGILFPSRYTHAGRLFGVAATYLGAKVFELADVPIYLAFDGVVSGHVIKHILGATAAYLLIRILQDRDLAKPQQAERGEIVRNIRAFGRQVNGLGYRDV